MAPAPGLGRPRGQARRGRAHVAQYAEAARLLGSYLDGETGEVTARRVTAHLEPCRRCGLDAGVYREIKNALARREPPDPSSVERLRAFGQSSLEAPGTDERSDQAGDPPAS